MTMCGLASDPDGGDIPSLRLFLLGFVLVALVAGLKRQWMWSTGPGSWMRWISPFQRMDRPDDISSLIIGDQMFD